MNWARVNYFLLLSTRLVVVAMVLGYLFSGSHPPAQAEPVPMLTVEDAVQDNNIKSLNEHLAATDDRIQKQWDTTNKLALDLAGIQGEERIFSTLIGGGTIFSIVLQVRNKKKQGDESDN